MDLNAEVRGSSRRKVMQENRDEGDGCHGDSGLLSMLAEVASATLHNDTLAGRATRNPRGRPRKNVENTTLPLDQQQQGSETGSDANKLNLAQIQLLTEKQLVDLFAIMDSDEIRRTFSYSCHLLQRCQYTSSSFGSEMKARQEMQKHLSQHVRDLMRKARESPEFRFSAAPVVSRPKKTAASSSSAATASAKNEPRTPSTGKVKEKIKIKLTPASSAASRRAAAASANSKQASPKKRGGAAAANKTNSRATKVKI